MSTSTYQERVAKFIQEKELAGAVEIRVLDLVAETGELAKEYLKSTAYGQRDFAKTPNWESELGDLFFSLITVANSTDVDLEEALEVALQKYEQRFREKQSIDSGF